MHTLLIPSSTYFALALTRSDRPNPKHRLSIDPSTSSNKRRRAREARDTKEDQMAALVGDLTAAARGGIGRRYAICENNKFGQRKYISKNSTTHNRSVRNFENTATRVNACSSSGHLKIRPSFLYSSGMIPYGRQGRGDERRHRHLRPRTSPEDVRGLCSRRPSPPPFPPRRRATSASGPNSGAARRRNCGQDRNILLADDHHHRHARGSDDHDFRPPCGREPCGEKWKSAMSEDIRSWIPQFKSFNRWENFADTTEAEEGQGERTGFSIQPRATSPKSRLTPPSPQSREFSRTSGSRLRYGSPPNQPKKGAMWGGRRARTIVSRKSTHQRPRWDARFWIRDRDAAPAVGAAMERFANT